MDWHNALSKMFADGLRALSGRYPTLMAISISCGFIIKIMIHVTANVYHTKVAYVLDEYSWYEYAIVTNGLFLFPSVFGFSRVPDVVLAQIAAIKKIMEEGNFTPHNRLLFWNNFLGKFIRDTNVSADLPSPDYRDRTSGLHVSDDFSKNSDRY